MQDNFKEKRNMLSQLIFETEYDKEKIKSVNILQYFFENTRLVNIIKSTDIGKNISYDNNNPDSIYDNKEIFKPETERHEFHDEIINAIHNITGFNPRMTKKLKIKSILLKRTDVKYIGCLEYIDFNYEVIYNTDII
jgi:hypothetical protein